MRLIELLPFTNNLYKSARIVSAVVLATVTYACGADVPANTDTSANVDEPTVKEELSPPSSSLWATLGMVRQLSKQHYAKVDIDDALSEQLLDEYVSSLDPARVFLLEEDIQAFQAFKHKLDNGLKLGNVSAAYSMYNVLQERAISQLEYQIAQLPQTIEKLDFTRTEYLSRDPESMPWAKDADEIKDRWRKRIKNDVLSLKLANKPDEEIIELLDKRLNNQLKRFNEINDDDVYTRFMNAFAGLYDPHTSHLSAQRRKNFDINMSRSLEGIGAVLSRDDEYTKVVRLVTAGPASRQGELKPSDRILGVAQDGEDIVNVVGWRLDEVVELIRGPKNTFVHLQVASKKEQSSGTTRTITIKRGKVELEDQLAKAEVIDVFHNEQLKQVGVISVPDFYADMDAQSRGEKDYRSVTKDVQKIVEDLKKQDISGIVIDLRGNGGGSLTEANNLTGLFIGSGPTVQIRGANDKTYPRGKYRGKPLYDGPLVVLINRLSASASEIFAGAIQDYGRGVVVGTTSFGKGTVQTILPLKEGAIKLTTAKFYRVSGQSTQYHGVEPDIHFPYLYDPEEVGESALDNSLVGDTIQAINHMDFSDYSNIMPRLQAMHDTRTHTDPDFVFFKDEFSLAQQQRNDDLIPLNIEERKAKQDKAEQDFLAIENKRRKAKGLTILASLDDLDEDSDNSEDAETSEEETALVEPDTNQLNYVDDAFAMEAANILLDQLDLLNYNNVVSTSPAKPLTN